MPAKIRLARHGRRKNAFYHIVVADARAPRDGKFIEKLGIYNPMTAPATIELDRDSAYEWIMKGAQPTDTARAILKFKGVFFRKHLQRGVKKGAFTQEEADAKLTAWIEDKESKIAERVAAAKVARADERRMISEGIPKSKPAPATEELAAFSQPEVAAVEETPAEDEAPVEKVEETTPVVEAISEAPSAEDLEEKVVEPEAVKEAAPEVKVTEEETIASAADEKAEATSDDKDSESSKEE